MSGQLVEIPHDTREAIRIIWNTYNRDFEESKRLRERVGRLEAQVSMIERIYVATPDVDESLRAGGV